MSQLGSNDQSKGEKLQSYVSQGSRGYNSNVERYARTHHERDGLSPKELDELKHRRDVEQFRALTAGVPRHSEYQSRESMNPASSTSHPAAVGSAANIYQRVSATQQGRSQGTHFESFSGISPNAPPTSSSHHQPIPSSAYRHLLPPHTLIPGQYNNSSAPHHIGLDTMWQQKLNPNPWILAHYEDMRLERERTLAAHERERTMAQARERTDQDRERTVVHERERNMAHERERNMAHERNMAAQERERERNLAQERERALAHERERNMTHERTIVHERERDHERIERQKDDRAEKDRQREWQEQERLEREERERAQREAVQQHFEESLRLALQKQKSMNWNPGSGSKNLGKGQENSNAVNLQPASVLRSSENDRVREQEKERAQYMDGNHARREHERWLAMVQQQRTEQAPNVSLLQNFSSVEPRSGRSKPEAPQIPGQGSSKSNLAPSPVSSSVSQIKNETNFSLYGYQPFQHTYITHAQLKAREETKVSGSSQPVRISNSGQMKGTPKDKDGYVERPLTPGSSHTGGQGSKQHLKVMHPSQDRSGMMYQPVVGSGGAFKPYEYSSNSSSPAPPAHQSTSASVGRIGAAHYQQLQDQPQNLVKGDGKNIPEKNHLNHKYDPRDSKPAICSSNPLQGRYSPSFTTSKSSSPSSNASYSYSLIQQGLVPNPMYTAATHNSSNANLSAPFMHSQPSSKTSTLSTSPPSQQYPIVSPNAGITAGLPVCRPSSVPYTLPPNRIARSYSPVGPLPGNNSGKVTSQETHLSNRSYVNVQGSSHRSPSPAHIYGTQSNPGAPNSPHQSSPRLNAVSGSPHLPVVSVASPFHSNSQSENSDNSGIPLVKRKLMDDISSRKRPKSVDDGLLPPQLQPQVQTLCLNPGESQVVTPPHLVSNAPILAELHLHMDFSAKSNPESPIVSNISYKPEPVTTPPMMPDLTTTQMTRIDSHSSAEIDSEPQNYSSILTKFKLSSKQLANASVEDSLEVSTNSQVGDNSGKATSPPNIVQESSEQIANTLSVPCTSTGNSSNSSSNFHPKLKKAWLQRHSENDLNKKPPDETVLSFKEDVTCNVKSEPLETSSENCKPVPYVLLENSICDKYLQEGKVKIKDIETDGSESQNRSIKTESVIDDESSSAESDSESIVKNGKRKGKSKSKYASDSTESSSKRPKSGNGTDANFDDQATSPKKDKEKKKNSESSAHSRKKGRKNKGRSEPEVTCKKRGIPKNVTPMTPPEKPSIAHLKKTGEPFLQDGGCSEVAPRLPKCRECRMTPHQRSKKMPNIFCRFYAYRKLRYGKNGTILSAGFSEPSDALEDDLRLWLPPVESPPANIEVETSKFLLTHVGDQFCDLVEMEREAQKLHITSDGTVTWKKVVQGVREMCDVCETTLFNIHWVCHKCGFVVCIDCYKLRKNGLPKEESAAKDRDDYRWLFCSNRQPHEQEKLMMTQIIAGTALWDVGKALHEIRRKWNIPTYCNCGIYDCDNDSRSSTNGICKLMSAVTKCFSSDKDSRDANGSSDIQKTSKKANKNAMNGVVKSEEGLGGYSSESGGSPLSWLADVALNSSKASDDQREKDDDEKSSEDQESNPDASIESDDEKNENFSTLRELLIRPTGKMGGKNSGNPSTSQKTLTSTLDEVISCVIEQKVRKSDNKCNEKQLLHFTRRYQKHKSGRDMPPVRTCILAESLLLYPEIPHTWLGQGKILLLKDPSHVGNMQLFQEQWKRGQPVVVADVGKSLDPSLWSPESFLREFGEQKSDFQNCTCGTLLQNQPMKKFWEGFDNIGKRMRDEDGESIILKLLDWPPAEEFSDVLPTRYDDLMKALPLPQYTHREGVFNMASRLPDCFVQPDLGPRMYNAYGISSSLGKGSTNLHLDVSDSVNILAHVSVPHDGKEELGTELLKILEECGCDPLMRKRAKDKNSNPGAIWHVYNAKDADKIRDFLNKVSEEQGVKLNPHHDPIHNQEWYLDEKLRNRLFKEYGVEPYTIAQCFGDAIFIPAGSPHQVMNIFSCVKVSEDFVSPESVGHSFFLTQEIRNLSDAMINNNDDRIQIKNIIYHAVKDALALLQSCDPEDSNT
ncbi:hypothetical protein JTE90_021577 [Oedothorax gibbosus]|uniref:Lysine-specific demethylase 3B n=1 Tax=Oedothorax gibbosus TaxID=931172 RepID=A0AAV6VQ26_9ARAC|nr:hypothetical protein JTE90_021577 [Oedothorax gibbosus]